MAVSSLTPKRLAISARDCPNAIGEQGRHGDLAAEAKAQHRRRIEAIARFADVELQLEARIPPSQKRRLAPIQTGSDTRVSWCYRMVSATTVTRRCPAGEPPTGENRGGATNEAGLGLSVVARNVTRIAVKRGAKLVIPSTA